MNKKNIIISLTKLISVGFIAKILSTLAKIIITREIGVDSMSIYSLSLPTMILLLNLAQAGFPTAIAKLIAQNRKNATKIIGTALMLSIILNIVVGIIYFSLVPYIAKSLLHNEQTIPTLYMCGFLMPLVCFSSILKAYFIGMGKVEKSSYCQISEEVFRILFILIVLKLFSFSSPSILSALAMISVLVGEVASIIHLLLETNVDKIHKIKFFYQVPNDEKKFYQKEILKVAIPTTSTRIIGSISYFLEPIIFTFLMINAHVSTSQISLEYGIINGYSMPLLLLPGFFASAFSLALLPLMSKSISEKKYDQAKKLLLYFTFASFFIGLIFTLVILINPEFFLNFLYKKSYGANYIKKYAIFMVAYYIQSPLNTAMVALSLEKKIFLESFLNNILKIIAFFIFIPFFKADGLILGVLVSVYFSIFFNIFYINRKFKKLTKEKSKDDHLLK